MVYVVFSGYIALLKDGSAFDIAIFTITNFASFHPVTFVFIQYHLLLLCLRSRFRSINAVLRCIQLIHLNLQILTHTKFGQKKHSFIFRQRFLNLNRSVQTIEFYKSDQTDFVKTMAHLYNMLCEVMDDMNICYSFQVKRNS